MQQLNFDWRPDWPSVLLGLVLGVLLAAAFLRIRPYLQRQIQRGRQWVEGRVAWMRSGVEVRFRSETAEYAQKQHLGQAWATLDQVFVPPFLTEPAAGLASDADEDGLHTFAQLWPELAAGTGVPWPDVVTVEQLMRNGRRMLIHGRPGSGKSSLLAYLAYQWAAVPADEHKPQETIIPLLLHLAEIDWTVDEEKPITALTRLTAALQKRSSPITSPGIGDMLNRFLPTGQCVLLLDGWNELPAARRATAVAWLQELLTTYAELCLFMVADEIGYGELLPLGLVRTHLLPWRQGQAQAFAEKWAVATGREPLPVDTFWRPADVALYTVLAYWQQQQWPDLARPARPNDLLQLALPLFLARKSDEPVTSPDDETLAFWQEVAFRMRLDDVLTLPAADVAALAAAALAPAALAPAAANSAGATPTTTATANGEATEAGKGQAARLRKSIVRCSLFGRWGNGAFSLKQTLWRDFLAAGYLARTEDVYTLEEHLAQPTWTQLFAFWASYGRAAALADKLLQMDGGVAYDPLLQLAEWLPVTEGKEEWRRQTMIRLGQLVRTPDLLPPLRCRALAGMMRSGENGLLQFAQQLAGRPDPLVRPLVAAVLPLLPTAESLPWLMQLAADEDGMVRQTAVCSLTLWQHLPKTEAAIVQALIGPDEALALLTAELLALNGPPGVEILQEALADEAVAVRRAAIHGLARLDEAWTPARLAEMERSDPVWLVQSAAAGAIEQIRKRQEPHTWQPILAVRQRWLSAATGKRPSDEAAALAAVVRVLQEDADEGARTAAANLLCFVPVMAAEEGLHTAVQSNNPKLKRAAFAALCVGDRAFAG